MIQGHGDDLYRYGNRVEINFSTNNFNHFDHSPLFGFLARKLHLITSYPEPEPTTLEQAIARQNGVSPDSIMVTNGATEAIYLMAQCFADRVSFIVQPTFAEYADACSMHGNTPPTDITTPTAADTFGSNTALWLCNPNNPTGNVVPHNELLDTMIPDEPEPILSPHQPGDGGILTMPLRDNVPEPPTDDWQLTTCPVCGAECWQTDTARRILALEPDVRTACTACALKGLGK